MTKAALPILALALLAAPLAARDSLGVFSDWGAFRDPGVPRCYAIAKAAPSTMQRDYNPYASVGTWPKKGIRGQVHFRMSRKLATEPRIQVAIGGKRFAMTGGGGDAWAPDKATDAAIVAAMRSGKSMTISATDRAGRRFSNTYDLAGAATALDAATVGCARLGQ
ncbi:MAG: hypothetical protein KJZ64_11055 [Sphingomonadaceae bacterium]|nr:hypothetical protein [Sphingomonadaceae bacterium]